MIPNARPLPWEVPLARRLPEAIECLICGRNGRQLSEAGTKWAGESKQFGVGIFWACAANEEHDYWQQFLVVIETLRKTPREPESDDDREI